MQTAITFSPFFHLTTCRCSEKMPKQVRAEMVSRGGIAAFTEKRVPSREAGAPACSVKGLSGKPLEPHFCAHAAQGAGRRRARAQGQEPGCSPLLRVSASPWQRAGLLSAEQPAAPRPSRCSCLDDPPRVRCLLTARPQFVTPRIRQLGAP